MIQFLQHFSMAFPLFAEHILMIYCLVKGLENLLSILTCKNSWSLSLNNKENVRHF